MARDQSPGPSRQAALPLTGMRRTFSFAASDLDPARLHRLGHDALERDAQQAVLEAGIADFDKISELEAPLERSCGNAAMQIVTLAVVLGTLAGHGEMVLLGHHLDVFGAEADGRQRDAIAVFAFSQNVEGRIAVVFTRACFEQVEEPIEAYRRAPIGRTSRRNPGYCRSERHTIGRRGLR